MTKKTKKVSSTSLSKAFKGIIWPRRKFVFIGLVLIIISRLASLVLPGASKLLMDNVVPNGDLEQLKWLTLAVIGAIIIQAVTSFGLTQILSVEAQNLIAELRSKVQAHVIKLPISYFDNVKTGELVSRIMTDVEGVRNLIGTGLVQMIGGIITSIICLIILINISAMMTLYVLVPVSIFGLISLKAFAKIRPIFRDRGKINAEVTGRLTESLGGIRVIKGFNAELQEVKLFAEGVDKLFKNIKSSLVATSFITSSATLLLGLSSAAIMAIGGYMIINGSLTFGDFLAFTLYLGFMIAPILQMSNIGSQLTEAFAGLDRTDEILSLAIEDDDPNRVEKIVDLKGDVRFEQVNFSYDGNKDVLHDINFTAKSGSVTALIGTSGSGKSTIAGLVSAFLNPASGKIFIDDYDLQKVTLSSYRQNLGVVLQDDFLFEGTIKENILFPRPQASEEELLHAISKAYVNEFTDRFDLGIDTPIGERGVKLSGGQQQRIAIARAILVNPKILILDEATSNLDTESEHYIQESLKELMVGKTTFVIAHRLSTIRRADQILVIENGKIVEQGKHDELLKKAGRYYELYTYQSRI